GIGSRQRAPEVPALHGARVERHAAQHGLGLLLRPCRATAPRARASSAAEAPTARRGRAGSSAGSVMEVIVGSPLVLQLTTGHAGGGDALVLEGEGGQLREGGCRR